MDGKIDNITHASAAVIRQALRELGDVGTVSDRTRQRLDEAQKALGSLCPECSNQ